jgi:dihydroxyacetone kinase
MIMGDGDCGEAVKTLCESVLAGLDAGWASSGSILSFLGALNAAVDDMGGTLGAILGILLSAFQSAIQSRASDHSPQDPTLYASALVSALDVLLSYTPAREGDRTVMDVLMPFATAFAESKSLSRAVTVAKERAESTALLKPRLGRASYVGEAASQEVPDPGAWAFYEMMHGLSVGLGLQASADS